MELTDSFIILSIFVFIAGFIDSIAGGGGLITIPAYINYGLDMSLLLGTNKLSSSTGTFVACVKYLRELKFEKKYLIKIFIYSFFFSFLGALFVSHIPRYILKIIILFSIPAISVYMIKKKDFGLIDNSSSLSEKQKNTATFFLTAIVSFYDGMLGPGTGTFLAVGYSKFVKYDILKSTALAKFTNLVSNISALTAFIILKKVDFKLGLAMAVISVAGNYIGSDMAIKNGAKIIKPLLFLISNAILIKALIDFIK
ncbi:MAG: TSUP family transporter [Elusimicrobiales bacterium]|nr:TSUP family transporter [Elusimicrobiales bacterium]HOL62570.1 TSUP family transporter [Elusimicrobiales bacterium]HPO95594.1 TSUP family transporter [Elusimicrobiales bacterium]